MRTMRAVLAAILLAAAALVCSLVAGPAAHAQPAPAPTAEPTPAPAPTPAPSPPALELKPYGFILVNTHFTDGVTSPSDIPVRAAREDESTFSIFPRQSRAGLRVSGLTLGSAKLEGMLEIDFWGLRGSVPSGGVTQTAPRLRLAFLRMAWANTSLTIGQDWAAAFAPLNANSLAHLSITPFSGSGNLWGRIPQIRLDHTVPVSGSSKLMLSAALLRPFGGDQNPVPVTQDDPAGAGELSGLPFAQARVALAGPLAGKTWTVGLAGHVGREDFGAHELDTLGVALDLSLPLGSVLALGGEAYAGKNLRMLFSSSFVLGDPADPDSDAAEVEVAGGWLQLTASAGKQSQFNAGYGLERLDDEQIQAGFQKNETYFANWIYTFNKNLKLALEVDHIRTTTLGQDDETVSATVVDLAWQLLF